MVKHLKPTTETSEQRIKNIIKSAEDRALAEALEDIMVMAECDARYQIGESSITSHERRLLRSCLKPPETER